MDRQDLVVIGAGTAGSLVALGVAKFGKKVTLIEKSKVLGGAAVHTSCIPNKVMLQVANIAKKIHDAHKYGINTLAPLVDLGMVNEYIAVAVNAVADNNFASSFRNAGGRILQGVAPKFIDKNTILFNDQKIVSNKFIIATGSIPRIPVIPGLKDVGFLTESTIFRELRLPHSLIIIGATAAALEFAQAFANFGVKVFVLVGTLQVVADQIDSSASNHLINSLERVGVEFYTNSWANEAYEYNRKKHLICCNKSGETFSLIADQILLCDKRVPNVIDLNLAAAEVYYTTDGIKINSQLRTSTRNIFALGGVACSEYHSTQVTIAQAKTLVQRLTLKMPSRMLYQNLPKAIFTDLEYASVGIVEERINYFGKKTITAVQMDFKENETAIINDAAAGYIKIYLKGTRIVGATILNAQASILIGEITLAIQLRATVHELAATMHLYPSLNQIITQIAHKYLVRSYFNRWFMHLNNKLAEITHSIKAIFA